MIPQPPFPKHWQEGPPDGPADTVAAAFALALVSGNPAFEALRQSCLQLGITHAHVEILAKDGQVFTADIPTDDPWRHHPVFRNAKGLPVQDASELHLVQGNMAVVVKAVTRVAA